MRWMVSVFIFLVFACPATAVVEFAGGTGEPDDPYLVATAGQLIGLGENPDIYDKHFKLIADIDLDPNLPGGLIFDRAVIAPNNDYRLGFSGIKFDGILNGNGYVIRNLTISAGLDYLGLFGYLGDHAVVLNLGLENVSIRGEGRAIGTIAGDCSGMVINSYSRGEVHGGETVGGLLGEGGVGLRGGVINCYYVGKVIGLQKVGGLVGEDCGLFLNCYSAGTVKGQSKVGGLIGASRNSNYSNCYSSSILLCNNSIGGLVGSGKRICLSNCFWDKDLAGISQSYGVDSELMDESNVRGLTTSQMRDMNTFLDAGWDFVGESANGTCDFWHSEPNAYPLLNIPQELDLPDCSGIGTKESPYIIRTPQDLGQIWKKPLAVYHLDGDIELSGSCWNTPVVPWFFGILMGNGHTINKLSIQSNSYIVGLFGYLERQSSISDLSLEEVTIDGNGYYAGAFAGGNKGCIVNCQSDGNVRGHNVVGGILGFNYGKLIDSKSGGAVNSTSVAGGLIGSNNGYIAGCRSRNDVVGQYAVGGLVGKSAYGCVEQCFNSGTIKGEDSVGGLVGFNTTEVSHHTRVYTSSLVTNSYNTGFISGETNVGALVGDHSWGSLSNCYSSGIACANDVVVGVLGNERSRSDWNESSVTNCFWNSNDAILYIGPRNERLNNFVELDIKDFRIFIYAGWDFVGESQNGTCDIWVSEPNGFPLLNRFNDSFSVELTGSGTPTSPYIIDSVQDLGYVCTNPTSHYRLVQDLDISGLSWTNAVIPWFGGQFDGQGHKICNLSIRDAGHSGLFGVLDNGALVKNLRLEHVSIHSQGGNVGALAGYSLSGRIENCFSMGSIRGAYNVGGLLGFNQFGGVATSCSIALVESIHGAAGGLLGALYYGSVINCYSHGSVQSSGSMYSCGLVGINRGGGITTSYCTNWVDSWDGGLTKNDINYFEGPGVYSCFWDTETTMSERSIGGGVGLKTIAMQDVNTYLNAGWDFVDEVANGRLDIWSVPEYGGYPVLAAFADYYDQMPDGQGVEHDPFLISTAQELNRVWFNPFAYYRLESDIDLIGSTLPSAVVPVFYGSLDGNGHVVRNLHISGAGYIGLFGRLIYNSQVSDLGLEDVNIVSTDEYVGSLAGESYGATIHSCFSGGKVSGDSDVGGLVGRNSYGHISDTYSHAEVKGRSGTGALVGLNLNGKILRSYSTGLVMHRDNSPVYLPEGIVGYIWDTEHPSINNPKGLTEKEMLSMPTYTDKGWDFWGENKNGVEDIWQFPRQLGYPVLSVFYKEPATLPGKGSDTDPYRITNLDEFQLIWRTPNASFRLETDIDLAGLFYFNAPIPWFNGVFDGNNHVIADLDIRGSDYLGLFAITGESTQILDLTLVDVYVSGSDNYVGGLVGQSNELRITGCHVSGSIHGKDYVGGLIGSIDGGSLADCGMEGAVYGNYETGGLVGKSVSSHFFDCTTSGTVSGNYCTGSLIGSLCKGSVSDCNSSITVNSSWSGAPDGLWGCTSCGGMGSGGGGGRGR